MTCLLPSVKKTQPFADQAIILFLAFAQYSPNVENHWNSSQWLICTHGEKQLYQTALYLHCILNPRNVCLILTLKFMGHEQSSGHSWEPTIMYIGPCPLLMSISAALWETVLPPPAMSWSHGLYPLAC